MQSLFGPTLRKICKEEVYRIGPSVLSTNWLKSSIFFVLSPTGCWRRCRLSSPKVNLFSTVGLWMFSLALPTVPLAAMEETLCLIYWLCKFVSDVSGCDLKLHKLKLVHWLSAGVGGVLLQGRSRRVWGLLSLVVTRRPDGWQTSSTERRLCGQHYDLWRVFVLYQLKFDRVSVGGV